MYGGCVLSDHSLLNELNRGHPTFFYQSQDELRTKELEFVRFWTNHKQGTCGENWVVYFHQIFTVRRHEFSKLKRTKHKYVYPMMAWLKIKQTQRKFDLYLQRCSPNDSTVARRSDLHCNVKYIYVIYRAGGPYGKKLCPRSWVRSIYSVNKLCSVVRFVLSSKFLPSSGK